MSSSSHWSADGFSCTFSELRASISSVASALLRSAVQRGERVVWLLPNGLEALQLSCACYQVGFPGKQWENGENPEGKWGNS